MSLEFGATFWRFISFWLSGLAILGGRLLSIVYSQSMDHFLSKLFLNKNLNDKDLEKPIADSNVFLVYKSELLPVRDKLNDLIDLRVSNGLDGISNKVDTIVLSGMGTYTILSIINILQR